MTKQVLPKFILKTFLLLTLSLNLAQATSDSQMEKSSRKALKDAFKNVSVEMRQSLISQAEIFRASPIEKSRRNSQDFSLQGWLKDQCGDAFVYQQEKDSFQWPEVSCQYTPDDGGFGGATAKVKCLLTDEKNPEKLNDVKVKYAEPGRKLSKTEIAPTFIAATVANLLGFYSNIYCPARVLCKGCPSANPWDNHRATAPKGTQDFLLNMALIELQPKVMNVRNPAPEKQYSQGLDFDELAQLSKDPLVRKKQAIEREAFLLWQHFLVDLDAFSFNQRIACAKGSLENGNLTCDKSVAYTHDYGHAFFDYMQLEKWKNQPMLISRGDGACIGGVIEETFLSERRRKNKAQWLGASFSEEARLLLLSKMEQIPESLWLEIFQLSRAKEMDNWFFRVNSSLFMEGVKSKIEQLQSARCLPLDSGQTLLGK
jgi:hypothetical protein